MRWMDGKNDQTPPQADKTKDIIDEDRLIHRMMGYHRETRYQLS